MSHLDISLLGPLSILRDGQPMRDPGYTKVLALLVFLAIESDRPHQRAALAGLLWPEQPEDSARHSLRQALTTLRRVAGEDVDPPCLLVRRDTIAFLPDTGHSVDVQRFLTLLDQRTHHNHADAARCTPCNRRLEEVVGLYRGEFLEGFAVPDSEGFENWIQTWRLRLHQHVIGALDNLATSHLAGGSPDAAIHAVRRLLEIEPMHEASHRRLMNLLWQTGKRSEALLQYTRCEAILDEELGVEPEEETIALYEAIRDGAHRPEVAHAPAPPASRNLYVPVTPLPLVGRERETGAILDLLSRQDCQLLTITGPGGSGKTRLSIHIASGPARGFADVVCFVPLASVRDADGVAAAIASALGIRLRGPDPPEQQLQQWLRNRSTLLILDNAEQLVEHLHLVPSLLENVPELTILVTSRERLNLSGEWVYNIGGLAVPHTLMDDSFEGYEAIDLFLDRLRQVRSGAPLHRNERPDVIRICQLVDGMPLALELAAAWATTLTLNEIAEGIRQSLDFLSASSRDQPDRHRSMRAVFDSSWELLTAEEQAAWRRFSIFENGFTLDAAQQVADATLPSLAALMNKSLMIRLPSGRYRLHGLLKQFGDEKLREHPEEHAEVMARHSRYYLRLLADHDELLAGRDQSLAMLVIENDIDNIRLAWSWAVDHEVVTELVASATSYWLFLVMHGWMSEGRSTFGAMLQAMERREANDLQSLDGCMALGLSQVYKGGFESGLGLYDGAISLMTRGIDCLRQVTTGRIVGIALNMLAAALNRKGQYDEARSRLEESLEELDRVRDAWGKAFSLNDLGMMLHLRFHDETGEQYCAQSREIFMQVGDHRGQAFASSNLGLIAMQRGDHQRALRLHREALALSEGRDDQWGVAMSLVQIGRVLGSMQDDIRAREHLHQAVHIAWTNSIAPVVLEALSEVAALDIRAGDQDGARTTLAAIARHPSVHDPVREHVLALMKTIGEEDMPTANVGTGDRWAVRVVNETVQELLMSAEAQVEVMR